MIAELNLQNTDSSVKSEGEEPNVTFTHQVKNILRINLGENGEPYIVYENSKKQASSSINSGRKQTIEP